MSHLHPSPITPSDAERDQRRLASIEEQIAGFERNLASKDPDICVPALQETIEYLRAEQAALESGGKISLESPRKTA